METNVLSKETAINQKIELVKGEFTASEAMEIISSLIDEKINFHKIQRLRESEKNKNNETVMLNDRITELEKEKEIARAYINNLRGLNKKLKISGTLEITE